MKNSSRVVIMALSTCAVLALAAPAMAQSAQSSVPSPAASAGSASDGDIVVTGSRVITNGNNSPTPVTIVSVAQLAATTPSNPSDALNKLPIFNNSQTAASPGNANANLTGNFLNLRSIGPIRTLILFDGHRVPSTSQDGTVDVNTLPQSLVQRIDVVTGGASAVYGSDAITGVVNYIIDRNFNGIKVGGQSGISSQGDAASYRATITAGTKLFDDRGHIEFSYDYYLNKGLPSKLDRPYGSQAWVQSGGGTTANPFVAVSNARWPIFPYGGYFLSGPFAGQEFTANGVTAPAVPGTPIVGGLTSGGSGGFLDKSRLVAALETHQAFGRFDYDLTDNVHFYTQSGFTRARNSGDVFNFTYLGKVIASDDPFLPTALQTPGGAFAFGKISETVPAQGIWAVTRSIYVNSGLTGSLADGVDFDLSYTHGDTRQRVTNTNNPNNGRFAAALDAVRDPATGNIVCNVTLTNPGLYLGCVPLNPFGPSSESAAAADYVLEDTTITNRNRMDDVALSLTATPFHTWAGPVKAALTGEYRRMSLSVNSEYKQNQFLDCTGLRFNCAPGMAQFAGSETNDAAASETVKEAAFELNVPLLKDSALGRSLDFNGAVRYADYSTSGGAWTWKAGLDWHVTDSLSIRATRSRDFRAPTLFDLYAPPNSFVFNFTDQHTNTTGTSISQSQGNVNLKPEVGNTLTAGIVFDAPFARGLSLAIDYYRIRITDAIASIGPDATTQTQCENSNGTSPLCSLFVRPHPFSDHSPDNFPTMVLNQSLNVASLKSDGIDAELNYRMALGAGALSLRALVNYQPHLITKRYANDAPVDAAGGPNQSKWRLTAFANYDVSAFSVAVQERWRSSQAPFADRTIVNTIPRIAGVAYTDLTLTAHVGKDRKYDLFLSVQNLFDKNPPLYVGATAATPGFFYPTVNGDDVIGRYFTAGFRARF